MLMLLKAALEFPGLGVSFSPWLLLFPQFSMHPEIGPWSGPGNITEGSAAVTLAARTFLPFLSVLHLLFASFSFSSGS